MNRLLKMGMVLVAKIVANLLLGLDIHHRQRLPTSGPAILVANHNSHLDALVLMSLFPLTMAHRLRPVANADYFLKRNRALAWFARQVLDIIPVTVPQAQTPHQTACNHRTFLKHCAESLAKQDIIILFPEGSRGQPGQLSPLQGGIAHLAKHHPTVPIIPIGLANLDKALPKGDLLPVPFVCGAAIGDPLVWQGDKSAFLHQLTDTFATLAADASSIADAFPKSRTADFAVL